MLPIISFPTAILGLVLSTSSTTLEGELRKGRGDGKPCIMYNIVMKHWTASSPQWTAKWFPHLHYSSFILPISFPLHPFSVCLPSNPSVIDKVGVAFIFFPLHINFQASVHKVFSEKREKVRIHFVNSFWLRRYQVTVIWIISVGIPYRTEPAELI